ncbi:MAG: riboflavin synthase, partial [Alphaproteobacteria bacterium]|nr:riboflavin synthase [Alphaproteobacteria bacterium]
MFTGLIQDIGTIRLIDDNGSDKRIVIETNIDLNKRSVGASIACSGCCLTVVEVKGKSFSVDVSAETLFVTALSEWKLGDKVNIEPSLRLGDEMGGHIVSGHVDGIATLESIKPDGESYRLRISVPEELSGFIASKGSVALDGISLTVNEVEENIFGVNIIPHTWEKTTL